MFSRQISRDLSNGDLSNLCRSKHASGENGSFDDCYVCKMICSPTEDTDIHDDEFGRDLFKELVESVSSSQTRVTRVWQSLNDFLFL